MIEKQKEILKENYAIANSGNNTSVAKGISTPLPGINQDFTHYKNYQVNFEIDYPTEAEVIEVNEKVIFYLENPIKMIVEVAKHETSLTLPQFVVAYVAFKEETYGDFTLIEPPDTSTQDQIFLMYSQDDQNYNAIVMSYFAKSNNNIYEISFIGIIPLEYEPFLDIQEHMLNSWVFDEL
jgi:hypothetical protein